MFKAPWEAQAFAIPSLHEHGAFSWKEWTEALAEVIGELRQRGEPDTGEQYYRHWLTALERIAARKGLVSDASLQTRRERWAAAARATRTGSRSGSTLNRGANDDVIPGKRRRRTTTGDSSGPPPRIAAPLCAALLGLLLLYAAGFAQTEAIHNGAHDARHAAGFACH